jgi:hypothetical protein
MNLNNKIAIGAVLAGLFSTELKAAEQANLTVVNNSDKTVYATAISIPADAAAKAVGVGLGTPLELKTEDGTSIPLIQNDTQDGQRISAILSLKPHEKMDFSLSKAESWGKYPASASFDAKSGVGLLSNGLIALEYANGKWSIAYANNPSETLSHKNHLDYWLSDQRHGRLKGFSDERLRAMNMLRSTENATIADGKAVVNPDGSATLVLQKRFPGIGENVVWEESFTLISGEPILIYKTRWTCTDDLTRYIAYVGLGGALMGEYGPLLQGKLRFKYENPSSGNKQTASGVDEAQTTKTSSRGARILLSGNNNSFTRISWRNERCWVGVDSELGNGLVFSTLKDANVRFIPGNTVWAFSNSNYLIRLLDHVQENQPYEFSKAAPLELGFAIAATCADVGIWNQGRHLFRALTSDKTPSIGDACTVLLNGVPIKAGEATRIDTQNDATLVAEGSTLRAFLETDFMRPYNLTAKVSGATKSNPLTITANSDEGNSFTLLKFTKPGTQTVDFTALTGWLMSRRIYTLEVHQGDKAKLESLQLEAAPFAAPKLDVPANQLEMTDVASFYRWYQVAGAVDYEIQLSRSKSFDSPTIFNVRSEVPKPHYMPSDAELPAPGKWFWRVRAMEEGRPGQWSDVRSFTVNNDIAKRPTVFKPTPEHPIFTMEGCRVPDWGRFKNTLPEDIKPYVAFNTHLYNTDDYIGYYRPLNEMGILTFIRTHGPGAMSHWMPLSMLEELFQTYPNVIGIMGGESLTSHYMGGEMQAYVNRLLKLCGKYGRIFYDADGTGPAENKWEVLYEKSGPLMNEYRDYLIFAQKNNILHRQFMTQSAVLGLYLSDNILAQGAWEDGGWYWQQTGFRKLGEIMGQRGGDVTMMPGIFWTLNYTMGLGLGCSVFSFEGQVGTTPVPKDWSMAEKGFPPDISNSAYRNPAAYWTTDGELLPAFKRFCLPFIRAVINRKLVPTKEEVKANVKIAVYNDGVPKKTDGDQYYYEWENLFRGTYGFRDIGAHPGSLMEYFPNTGRYFYFPVLPQGKRNLGEGIDVRPLSQFTTVDEVKTIFNAAYPAWYTGDALVNIVGNTISVLNSNENIDEIQTYSVPLKDRGLVNNIAGKIGTHAYLLGKFEDGNKRLWLQANSEYSDRDTEVTLTLKSAPKVVVTPANAAKVNRWDEAAKTLTLALSHTDGAVEVEISDSDAIHASQSGSKTIYVSPEGNDENNGTVNAPLATLYAAQDLARRAEKTTPLTIAVAGGTYYLDRPLTLTSEDSGTQKAPVTWTATGQEPVRLVGGKPLAAKWRKHTDAIWKTQVPGDVGIDQLFVNKKRQILARYPNYNPNEQYFDGAAPTWERMSQWKNKETAYIHALTKTKWGSIHARIQQKEDGELVERMVTIDTTSQGNRSIMHDDLRFAENVFEELDAPGEWFFDEKTRTLYYQPEADVDLNVASVEMISNPYLIWFKGTKDNPVQYVTFNGFLMTGASPTWEKTTDHLPNGGDFVVHRGGAVLMQGTEDCMIQDCTFRELGGNAVFIDGYNRRATVKGCFIQDIGANGIALCGSSDAMRGDQFFKVTDETFQVGRLLRNSWETPKGWFELPEDLTPGPKTENYPADCLITDNLITEIGELEKQTAGILMSMTRDNTISHNTIYKLPRAGICLNDGSWGGHIIEYNDVYDTVRETADHGPFNSWGRDRFWIWENHKGYDDTHPNAKQYALIDAMNPTHIRHNRFAHPLNTTHNWGIDLDDGSTNYKIYNNLTLGCSVKLREGFYRTVENNVFIASGKNTPGKHVCFPKNDDVYRNNIVVNYSDGCVWLGYHHNPLHMKLMDENIYYTPGYTTSWLTKGRSKNLGSDMKDWQAVGLEVNSIIADPLFIDPAKGDYRVKPNSPAIKLGFKNFAMDQFGVKSNRLKALLPERDLSVYAKTDSKAAPGAASRDDRKVSLLGGSMKNMTTDMEKSVVGIGEITGVLVMEVPHTSLAYKSGLRVGDLIIGFGDKKIHDLNDLLEQMKSSLGKVIELHIHDDSKAHIIKVHLPDDIHSILPPNS